MTPLEESIKKWEAIAQGEGRDLGSQNCALCRKYLRSNFDPTGSVAHDCVGCPVYEYTGSRHCRGSLYEDWHYYQWSGGRPIDPVPGAVVFDLVSGMLADLVLLFLKELRDEAQ